MKMTRRFFLQSSGAIAAYCGVAPLGALGAVAETSAAPVTGGKTLVVIFLRGGIDGLNLIVPYADPGYADLRKSLLIKRPGQNDGCLDLDGAFGLHPRAAALMPWLDSGTAVAAHAVGYGKNTRSHFEEQDTWETGVIGNTVGSDGWLNRHLQTSQGHGPIRAVALGDTLPRILRGDASAYAISGLTDLGLPKSRHAADITAALEHAYTPAPAPGSSPGSSPPRDGATSRSAGETSGGGGEAVDLVQQTGTDTLEGMKLIQTIAQQDYQPKAPYPETALGRQLQSAARLIKGDIGLEVIEIDYGGWDTHNNQGTGIAGTYGDKVQALADAMAAFALDMGDRLDDTLVLTLSDFGRTARENGTRGTDHGWANALLALGGPVTRTGTTAGTGPDARRKVVTDWPGLLPDQLHQNRDLKHTTDFRDVIAEAVGVHLGNEHLGRIIPNHAHQPVGLIA